MIAVIMVMSSAAPALAQARRSSSAAESVGYQAGRLLGLGLFMWFIKSLVSRRNDDRRYTTTIEPADPPHTGPQLVGLACVHCGQKVFIEGAAALCHVCNQPVHHLDCRKSHLEGAHGEA